MNKLFRFSFLAVALFGLVILAGCDDGDPPLPDNKATFQSDAQGLGAAESEITVNLALVRAVDVAGTITVSYTGTGVVYGDDFITDPVDDNADGKIVVPVAAGATSASFKVTKTNTTGLEGNEKVVFTIDTVSDGLVLGDQKTFTLSFAEIIAQSAAIQVDGGGSTAPNIVFIDLSGNRQTVVARTAWDLAFSSKADEFRVVLNSPSKMLARVIDKTDITAVNASDAVDFDSQLSLEAIFGVIGGTEIADYPDWIYSSLSWMDDPKGDITKTAIAEVSATDSENKVYIVNRGTSPAGGSLGFVKIRVLRNGNNYTLQYADIDATDFESVTITKNTTTRFQFVSLTSGAEVNVEPEATKWDIAWTGFTNITPTGDQPTDPFVPYYFQDIILTNLGNASTFTYSTGTTGSLTYDTFGVADINGIAFVSNNQLSIGSTWRSGGGPPGSPPPGVNTTRFYLVKDADGNVYKLKFTDLTTDGERGKPKFKFELLQKGA